MSRINNLIIVVLILICSVTQGQLENDQDISKVGTTAAQFLKISSGGRGLAMGSANVAITNNLSSSFWNPAGLAHVKGIQVYFENNGWLAGTDYNFGSFGLKATSPGRITARQIEASRRAITRHMKRSGRVWIRVFPDVPVTQKPAEVRQGKGKGAVEFWACRIKPGRIMFELDGVDADVAREAFALASAKLPVQTRFIQRIGS